MKQTYSLETPHAGLTTWQPKKLPTFSDALALVKETLFMQLDFPIFIFRRTSKCL